MPEKTREWLPSKALLVEKGGRFYFFDPSLDTIASGPTVEQAYKKFSELATTRAVDIAESEVARSIRPPPGVGRELSLFALKFCLALVILAGIAVPLATTIIRGIEGAVSQVAASVRPISLADIASKAADIARDAENLSPQTKASLRQSIAIIKRELGQAFDSSAGQPESPVSPKQ